MGKIVYLVDTENVAWTPLLEVLNDPDEKMVLYHSAKEFKMTYDQLKMLMKKEYEIDVEGVVINGEKNALDFQLVATLGLDIEKENQYVIVAKDKGYDAAIKKFIEKGFQVRRMEVEDIKSIHKSITETVKAERAKQKNNEIAELKRKAKQLKVEESNPQVDEKTTKEETNVGASKNIEELQKEEGIIEVNKISETEDFVPQIIKPADVDNLKNSSISSVLHSSELDLLQKEIDKVPIREIGAKNRTKNKYFNCDSQTRRRLYDLVDDHFNYGRNKTSKANAKAIKKAIVEAQVCENLGNKILSILGVGKADKKKVKTFLDNAGIKDVFYSE